MPVKVPPVQASLVSRCVSTYDLLAACPPKVGEGKLVNWVAPPMLMSPVIVPPERGRAVATQVSVYVFVAAS